MEDVSTKPATSGKKDKEIAIPYESDKEIEASLDTISKSDYSDQHHRSKEDNAQNVIVQNEDNNVEPSEDIQNMQSTLLQEAFKSNSDHVEEEENTHEEGGSGVEIHNEAASVKDEPSAKQLSLKPAASEREDNDTTTNTTLPATLIDGQRDTSKNEDFVLEAKESPITRSGHTKKSDENEGTQTHIIIHYICITLS